VSNAIARGLRARGVDVTTTAEVGLQNASDDSQLEYIESAGRVIVTQDDDFLRFHSAGQQHPGIIYSKHENRSVGEIIRFLQLVNDCLDPDDMRGRVEYF